MSGYLEVKYPFKSNLGLNPFKSWKRQWCILRPSPTSAGGSLAVYCSEAGAPAGTVELRTGCIVKRAKSRTRPYAFAVFSIEEPGKPRILLAAQNLPEAQLWMGKIRDLLNGEKLLGTETLLKDSYSVTIIPTGLSLKCGVATKTNLTLSSNGLILSKPESEMVIHWQHITNIIQTRENGDKNKTCVLSVDSTFNGGGELKFSSVLGSELVGAIKLAMKENTRSGQLSRSQPELSTCQHGGDLRRSSWYSGPSEVSLDDTDLIMSKEARSVPRGQLSRCAGAGDLAPCTRRLLRASLTSLASLDDSMCDRRSMVSIASGVYEEISEEPREYRELREEPTYESVAECVYATMRRTGKRYPPPPLPPRTLNYPIKMGESWSCHGGTDAGVTRHSSLGSLHHKPSRPIKPFSVFRKRLKSDSRIATSPKTETKDKDVETKKKKFDFTPTRDIFKSFKVSRKMKNLKITGLSKGETKSCEFLDETQHVTTNRCSKSVECLEDEFEKEPEDYIAIIRIKYEDPWLSCRGLVCTVPWVRSVHSPGDTRRVYVFDADYSKEFGTISDEAVESLALPQEIVQLILSEDVKMRLKETQCEGDYMPMSPIVPIVPVVKPMEHHYMVMSPRTKLA